MSISLLNGIAADLDATASEVMDRSSSADAGSSQSASQSGDQSLNIGQDAAFSTDTVTLNYTSQTESETKATELSDLRKRIDTGEYHVSSTALADAMLRKGLFNPSVQ